MVEMPRGISRVERSREEKRTEKHWEGEQGWAPRAVSESRFLNWWHHLAWLSIGWCFLRTTVSRTTSLGSTMKLCTSSIAEKPNLAISSEKFEVAAWRFSDGRKRADKAANNMVQHGYRSQFTIHIGQKMRFLEEKTNGDLEIPCSELILREAHLVPWVSTILSRKPILTFSWSIDGLWPCTIHFCAVPKFFVLIIRWPEINWSFAGSGYGLHLAI